MARFIAVVLVLAYLVTMTYGWPSWKPCDLCRRKYERVLGEMTKDQVFRALDENKDDFLTTDEWVEDGGEEMEFIQLLKHADKNEDEKISLAEFKMLKNPSAGQ